MHKYGVEFVSPDHERAPVHRVRRGLGQVDALRLAGAPLASSTSCCSATPRARARAPSKAAACARSSSTPTGATVAGRARGRRRRSWRARYLVDASGRDTLLANQFRCKEKNPKHNSSALYGHFTGAERLPGRLEGNITIFWFEHGWFWFIPLADGSTSIGAVCWPYYLKSRSKPLPEFFRDTIALCPALAERLAGAALVAEVHATGNYSYSERASRSGERYLLLGDAYAFIDPVFSSGVYLAMQSAFAGAEVVETMLDRPREAARRAARASTARRGAARASSRGSSSASPARRCASSSCRRRTRCASRKR